MDNRSPPPPYAPENRCTCWRSCLCVVRAVIITIALLNLAATALYHGYIGPTNRADRGQTPPLAEQSRPIRDLAMGLHEIVKKNRARIAALEARETVVPKKRLMLIPLDLIVAPEVAHTWMINGSIMGAAYREFAARQHNMNIATLVKKFMEATPSGPLLFNLDWMSITMHVRAMIFLGLVAGTPIRIRAEVEQISVPCVSKHVNYAELDGIGHYNTIVMTIMWWRLGAGWDAWPQNDCHEFGPRCTYITQTC